MIAWLAAFAITVGLEAPIVAALVPSTRGVAATVAAIVLAQLVTHPLVWWLAPVEAGVALVLVAELSAVLVEAALYALVLRAPGPRALAASLLANAASVALGLALTRALT